MIESTSEMLIWVYVTVSCLYMSLHLIISLVKFISKKVFLHNLVLPVRDVTHVKRLADIYDISMILTTPINHEHFEDMKFRNAEKIATILYDKGMRYDIRHNTIKAGYNPS